MPLKTTPFINIKASKSIIFTKAIANSSGTPGSFDKWDFKLYTRDTTGFANNPNNGAAFAGEKEPFVECGSCHDPHFETTTFLRMPGTTDLTTNLTGGTTSVAAVDQSNTGSRVCLTCHTK